jgi:hypothetical protein
MAVLFRYGVAVLLGASPDAERALRERLSARTENAYESAESEELDVRISTASSSSWLAPSVRSST